MNHYDLWIADIEGYEFSTTAKTPGKAKYQFYQYLQFGIWEMDFSYFLRIVRCKKVNV